MNEILQLQLPFTSKRLMIVAANDAIYFASTQEFLMRIYNPGEGGLFTISIRLALEEGEAIDQFHSNRQGAVKNAGFPDTRLVFLNLLQLGNSFTYKLHHEIINHYSAV